jgi:hypothetical protein
MQNGVTQVYYFHASATSLGGFLNEPSYHPVYTPSSVALSATGGDVTNRAAHFGFENVVQVSAAYTHASGRPVNVNGPWVQRVTSITENFNLLGKITAKQIVAQVVIEQPAAKGGDRKISFAGSQFTDLRINGEPVKVDLDATLLPTQQRTVDAYNQSAPVSPTLQWPALTDYATRQGSRFSQTGAPDWVQKRLNWIGKPTQAAKANGGYTLCSLVNQVEGVKGGTSYAHCIELPDIGRIFLGEITVLPYAAHLTMIRAELGCKVSGQVSCCMVSTNGTSMPPSD